MIPREAPSREAVRQTLESDGSETVRGSVCAATEVVVMGRGQRFRAVGASEGAGMEGGSSTEAAAVIGE